MDDALSGILDLRRSDAEPLHSQIAAQIKNAVIAGKLPASSRLPPSRALAARLGVSRNTVLSAVEQLKAEGLLLTRPGGGTHVADFGGQDFEQANLAGGSDAIAHRLAPRWNGWMAEAMARPPYSQEPFMPGFPDLTSFPAEIWGTCLRRAARLHDAVSAGYKHIPGHPRFRQVLAEHLAEARGVRAEPEQILVTSSARAALSLIASALLSPGEECWIEEPGFRSARTILSAGGAKLVPVPVDEQGMDPSRAPLESCPRLVYTTPSHQYPTGALMSLARRIALLETVSARGGYIIEDDYDSEFQYCGRPIAALQGLDQAECVLYVGTFAKSLMPALRVGFAVVPPGLAEGFAEVLAHGGTLVPPVIQLALADFMERGHYRAHVRRMKSVYAERLDSFAKEIARCSGGALVAGVPGGGLQTVVKPADGVIGEVALWRSLHEAGVASQPLSSFHLEPQRAAHCGLLMNFAAWPEGKAAKGFARLETLFRRYRA